jgi:hypothetical protein
VCSAYVGVCKVTISSALTHMYTCTYTHKHTHTQRGVVVELVVETAHEELCDGHLRIGALGGDARVRVVPVCVC